ELEWKLNTITFRQALNALKHSDVQVVLYCIHNLEMNADVEVKVRMKQLHGPEFQAVIAEYSDIFKNELSDHLSSTHDLVHEIDISDSESINRSVYQLSTWRLNEQITQIINLVSKRLLRESIST